MKFSFLTLTKGPLRQIYHLSFFFSTWTNQAIIVEKRENSIASMFAFQSISFNATDKDELIQVHLSIWKSISKFIRSITKWVFKYSIPWATLRCGGYSIAGSSLSAIKGAINLNRISVDGKTTIAHFLLSVVFPEFSHLTWNIFLWKWKTKQMLHKPVKTRHKK